MAVRWLDLVDPTREQLVDALEVHVASEVLEMLLAAPVERPRPHLEGHGEYVFGVLVAMSPVPEEDRIESREVGFVATAERFMPVRKTPPVGEAWAPECLEVAVDVSVGELVFRLVDDVADSFLDVVDAADAEIDELEDHIDDWPSARVRRRISSLRHDLIHARRTVGATRAKVRRIMDKRLDIANEELFPGKVERLLDDTALAQRPASVADSPTVPDEQVWKTRPIRSWDDALEIALDLDGIVVPGEPQAL